jgi:hypothetical protein
MLNTVIFIIPLYYLSVYQISKWVLWKIDALRWHFLWEVIDHGGLGVLELNQMNIAHLTK